MDEPRTDVYPQLADPPLKPEDIAKLTLESRCAQCRLPLGSDAVRRSGYAGVYHEACAPS